MRIGFGYDVHRLIEGRRLLLGGVEVPFGKGLLGHSDADVLLHAIIDSILGAAALGDIGTHFPPSDERYKDVSSILLLSKTGSLLEKEGYMIGNIDSTIVCEAPKLSPFIPLMVKNITRTLGCEEGLVSVKAKTEEGLGFTGSGQGISAYSVTIIKKREEVG